MKKAASRQLLPPEIKPRPYCSLIYLVNYKTMTTVHLTPQDVAHVAKLAHLPLKDDDVEKRTQELQSILGYMSKIQEIDTKDVEETLQITPTDNTMREDVIDTTRTFSQAQAVQNARESHEGFIMM